MKSNVLATENAAATAEGAPKAPEQKERARFGGKRALDQQLKDGIALRRDSYRSIRGERDVRNRILDAGPEGVPGFPGTA